MLWPGIVLRIDTLLIALTMRDSAQLNQCHAPEQVYLNGVRKFILTHGQTQNDYPVNALITKGSDTLDVD